MDAVTTAAETYRDALLPFHSGAGAKLERINGLAEPFHIVMTD